MGLAYSAVERNSDAVNEYQAALDINPDFTDARLNLGVALRELGREMEAVKQFRLVLENEPDNLPALHNVEEISRAMAA